MTTPWPPTSHQHVQDAVTALRTAPPAHAHPVTDVTATGARSSTTFLRGDGTWAVPPAGTGTSTTGGAYTSTRWFRPEDFGATGNGTTDDTAAVQAAYNAAKKESTGSTRRGGRVLLSSLYGVTAPIKFFTAVSTIGLNGWSLDSVYYVNSGFKALSGFVGDTILKIDSDGVTHPTYGTPDLSWHWGVIEKIVIHGTGKTGPNGIDVGFAGEATTIRDCSFNNLNAGITTDGAVSLILQGVSMFNCAEGLEVLSGKVQVHSISGDKNTNLVKISGGRSTNVNIFGLKAESIGAANSANHDVVVDIVDLADGRVTIIGGLVDKDTAGTIGAVVRITRTGTQLRPHVRIEGVEANEVGNPWMVWDTISGQNVPTLVDGTKAPSVFANVPVVVTGHGNVLLHQTSTVKKSNDASMSAFTTKVT